MAGRGIPSAAKDSPAVAIVGSGPAGLMAADVVSKTGCRVILFEKRKSAGRKLLVAGSSGLNVTNGAELERFIGYYTGPPDFWRRVIQAFPPAAWIHFIEELGIKTFLGSSRRYFVEDMRAAKFLQAWIDRLARQGVTFQYGMECTDFSSRGPGLGCRLSFTEAGGGVRRELDFDAACFALGGGSWVTEEAPLRWPELFKKHGLAFEDLTPSNVGYRIDWTEAFLKEAEGLPLKGVVFTSSKARHTGDVMVTKYGIEGTPVYFAGVTGTVHLDLLPALSVPQILQKLRAVSENLSPIRRVKRQLTLCPAAYALVFHSTPKEILYDPELTTLAERIKAFPLELLGPQPLAEAISSAGGLKLTELDDRLMLKRMPGIFAAGEMLDWDVPTGGFLIQGCVSQGVVAGRGILEYLGREN